MSTYVKIGNQWNVYIRPEYIDWLRENIGSIGKDNWYVTDIGDEHIGNISPYSKAIYFDNEADALAFRLRFGL